MGKPYTEGKSTPHDVDTFKYIHNIIDDIMHQETLFKWGEFTSHSGLSLPFKIDCDALTDDDISCIAKYIASKQSFGVVEGIPSGGLRLSKALEEYAVFEAPFNVLIVDDVLTTGRSMELRKAEQPPQVHPDDIVGWVMFARTEIPNWINAVFKMCE